MSEMAHLMRSPTQSPTFERVSYLLDYNAETGKIVSKVQHGRWHPGDTVGTLAGGYLSIGIDGKLYRGHRIAWLLTTGSWPDKFIDHIDGDKLNNRWQNLREVTNAENMQNCHRARVNSTLGILGVHPSRGKFCAAITVNGKIKALGRFLTIHEAEMAYRTAKQHLHPTAYTGEEQ